MFKMYILEVGYILLTYVACSRRLLQLQYMTKKKTVQKAQLTPGCEAVVPAA